MYKYICASSFILASSSPRRKELLGSTGIDFKIAKPDCDESLVPGEAVEKMVSRLSIEKAQNIAERYPASWILAADTTVYIDGEILGKPSDSAEAFSMLKKISGRPHQVWGGITLMHQAKNISITQTHCTEVIMRKLSDNEIEEFIKTGEPMDKAGAYAIQGIGAGLVSKIAGSYTNVVGLNLSAVIELLIQNSIIK